MVHKTYFKSISWISTSKNAAEIQPLVKHLYVRQQDSMRWYRQCLISTTFWSPGHFGLCLCCPTARWPLLRRHSWQDQARPGEVGTNWIQSNSDFVQDCPNILLILCMGDSSQNEAPVRHLSLCRITTRSCTKSLMFTQCSQINPSPMVDLPHHTWNTWILCRITTRSCTKWVGCQVIQFVPDTPCTIMICSISNSSQITLIDVPMPTVFSKHDFSCLKARRLDWPQDPETKAEILHCEFWDVLISSQHQGAWVLGTVCQCTPLQRP